MKASKWFLLCEALALASLAVLATSVWRIGAEARVLVPALAVAYAVPRCLYRRLAYRTPTGAAVLLGAWLLCATFALHTAGYAVAADGCSLAHPRLFVDDWRYYCRAVALCDTGAYNPPGAHEWPGVILMIALMRSVFGPSIAFPMAANVMMTLTAIVCASIAVRRALHGRNGRSDRWNATAALIAASSLFYMMWPCRSLFKEPMLCLGVALTMTALADEYCHNTFARRECLRQCACLAGGVLLVALGRTPYAVAMLAGVLLIMLPRKRSRRAATVMTVTLAAVIVAVTTALDAVPLSKYASFVDTAANPAAMSWQFGNDPTQAAYTGLIGDYFAYTWWQKALMLPLTIAVEYVTPFPWPQGSLWQYETLARMQWGWYAVGALTLFFVIRFAFGRGRVLRLWPLWAALCYALPCYAIGGYVSRYSTPFQLLMLPMAVYVVSVAGDKRHRKAFTIFAAVFALLLATALASGHILQSRHLPL